MEKQLQSAELRVMNVLWDKEEATASQIAAELGEKYRYSKTTTYTLIKRCIEKGAAARVDPGFVCRPLLGREEVQRNGLNELLDKLYGGRADRLVAAVLEREDISPEEAARLRELVRRWSDGTDAS